MLHEKLQKQVPAWALVAVAMGMILLFVAGSGIYNSGWSNGLTVGLLAGSGEGGKLLANQGYVVGHGWGHAGGFLGGILHFFFFIFVMSIIFRILGAMRWKMHMAHQMYGNGEKNNGEKHNSQQPWGGPPWAHRHPQWQQSQPQPQQPEGNVPISPGEKTGEDKPQNTSWIV